MFYLLPLFWINTFRQETTATPFLIRISDGTLLLQGHYINHFSSYKEKNGRWSTLLNLYGYHSLGTAYYYHFTTFLQSCSCAVFCIGLEMSLWPCVEWVNLTLRRYWGQQIHGQSIQVLSHYLLTIYSLLTLGTYKYVKDTRDAKNAKQMFRFGSAMKN